MLLFLVQGLVLRKAASMEECEEEIGKQVLIYFHHYYYFFFTFPKRPGLLAAALLF